MPDDLPPVDFLSLVSLAGAAIDRHVTEELVKAGFDEVRPAFGYVIQRLLTGPQQISAMAADLGVAQQAISKTVKEMVRLGFAEQSIDADDSRRRPVVLTARGLAAVGKARASRSGLEKALAHSVGADDLVSARVVVTALLAQLGLMDQVVTRTVPLPIDS